MWYLSMQYSFDPLTPFFKRGLILFASLGAGDPIDYKKEVEV